jgi:hypothetical protein
MRGGDCENEFGPGTQEYMDCIRREKKKTNQGTLRREDEEEHNPPPTLRREDDEEDFEFINTVDTGDIESDMSASTIAEMGQILETKKNKLMKELEEIKEKLIKDYENASSTATNTKAQESNDKKVANIVNKIENVNSIYKETKDKIPTTIQGWLNVFKKLEVPGGTIIEEVNKELGICEIGNCNDAMYRLLDIKNNVLKNRLEATQALAKQKCKDNLIKQEFCPDIMKGFEDETQNYYIQAKDLMEKMDKIKNQPKKIKEWNSFLDTLQPSAGEIMTRALEQINDPTKINNSSEPVKSQTVNANKKGLTIREKFGTLMRKTYNMTGFTLRGFLDDIKNEGIILNNEYRAKETLVQYILKKAIEDSDTAIVNKKKYYLTRIEEYNNQATDKNKIMFTVN